MNWKSKTKRTERRFRTGTLLLTLAVLGIAMPVIRYGPRLYSRWEQKRLGVETRRALDAGDYRKAALSARRIVELNPGNLEASRLFAEIADRLESPESVALRERVSLLAPDSFDDAYAMAQTALKFGNTAVAQEGFAIMRAKGPDRAETHEIAARLALTARNLPLAQAEFTQALKLAPGNEMFQLEAAVLQVQSTNPAAYEAARQTLEHLRAGSSQRIGALRALSVTYASRGQIGTAIPLAREMAEDPKANLQDRLVYLGILQAAHAPAFTSYLTSLQTAAVGKPLDLAMLAGWMNSHQLPILARDWLKTMPAEITGTPPVALKLGETYILLQDWEALQALTKNRDWGDFDFMRLAYLSRALSAKGDEAGAEVPWEKAAALASHRPDWLHTLEKTAISWGWDGRVEKLLWDIAANSNHPQEALETLATRYQRIGDTHDLYHAISELLDHDPANSPLKNNWAMLSLLLQADTGTATQTAQDLYDANPSNPHLAATYAFSLYVTNRTDDALAVMRKLPPAQLDVPSISAYYGIMLAAIHSPEAAKYLRQAQSAVLLPEEKRLIEKAQRSVQDK